MGFVLVLFDFCIFDMLFVLIVVVIGMDVFIYVIEVYICCVLNLISDGLVLYVICLIS